MVEEAASPPRGCRPVQGTRLLKYTDSTALRVWSGEKRRSDCWWSRETRPCANWAGVCVSLCSLYYGVYNTRFRLLVRAIAGFMLHPRSPHSPVACIVLQLVGKKNCFKKNCCQFGDNACPDGRTRPESCDYLQLFAGSPLQLQVSPPVSHIVSHRPFLQTATLLSLHVYRQYLVYSMLVHDNIALLPTLRLP